MLHDGGMSPAADNNSTATAPRGTGASSPREVITEAARAATKKLIKRSRKAIPLHRDVTSNPIEKMLKYGRVPCKLILNILSAVLLTTVIIGVIGPRIEQLTHQRHSLYNLFMPAGYISGAQGSSYVRYPMAYLQSAADFRAFLETVTTAYYDLPESSPASYRPYGDAINVSIVDDQTGEWPYLKQQQRHQQQRQNNMAADASNMPPPRLSKLASSASATGAAAPKFGRLTAQQLLEAQRRDEGEEGNEDDDSNGDEPEGAFFKRVAVGGKDIGSSDKDGSGVVILDEEETRRVLFLQQQQQAGPAVGGGNPLLDAALSIKRENQQKKLKSQQQHHYHRRNHEWLASGRPLQSVGGWVPASMIVRLLPHNGRVDPDVSSHAVTMVTSLTRAHPLGIFSEVPSSSSSSGNNNGHGGVPKFPLHNQSWIAACNVRRAVESYAFGEPDEQYFFPCRAQSAFGNNVFDYVRDVELVMFLHSLEEGDALLGGEASFRWRIRLVCDFDVNGLISITIHTDAKSTRHLVSFSKWTAIVIALLVIAVWDLVLRVRALLKIWALQTSIRKGELVVTREAWKERQEAKRKARLAARRRRFLAKKRAHRKEKLELAAAAAAAENSSPSAADGGGGGGACSKPDSNSQQQQQAQQDHVAAKKKIEKIQVGSKKDEKKDKKPKGDSKSSAASPPVGDTTQVVGDSSADDVTMRRTASRGGVDDAISSNSTDGASTASAALTSKPSSSSRSITSDSSSTSNHSSHASFDSAGNKKTARVAWKKELLRNLGVGWMYVGITSNTMNIIFAILFLLDINQVSASDALRYWHCIIAGICALISYSLLTSYLRYFPKLYIFLAASDIAAPALRRFLIACIPLFFGTSMFGYVMFGTYAKQFHDVEEAFCTLVAAAFGDSLLLMFQSTSNTSNPWLRFVGRLYSFFFISLYYFVIQNLSTAIAVFAFAYVQERYAEHRVEGARSMLMKKTGREQMDDAVTKAHLALKHLSLVMQRNADDAAAKAWALERATNASVENHSSHGSKGSHDDDDEDAFFEDDEEEFWDEEEEFEEEEDDEDRHHHHHHPHSGDTNVSRSSLQRHHHPHSHVAQEDLDKFLY